MMPVSAHLDAIIRRQTGSHTLQVVFADVEKYSKRNSRKQREIIASFTQLLLSARKEISQHYVEYTEKNSINFSEDIIFIPTGDGAAVVFSFPGLDCIHLDFAETLLRNVSEHNSSIHCEKFRSDGWCNCHTGFHLRVGVSEGKGIIYRDANDNYNAAGTCLNMAARVMGYAGRDMILMTREAHDALVDMSEDPTLVDSFRMYKEIPIKHGERVDIFQYAPTGSNVVNLAESHQLNIMMQMKDVQAMMPGFSDFMDMEEPQASVEMTKRLAAVRSFVETVFAKKILDEEIKSKRDAE